MPPQLTQPNAVNFGARNVQLYTCSYIILSVQFFLSFYILHAIRNCSNLPTCKQVGKYRATYLHPFLNVYPSIPRYYNMVLPCWFLILYIGYIAYISSRCILCESLRHAGSYSQYYYYNCCNNYYTRIVTMNNTCIIYYTRNSTTPTCQC